VAVASTSGMSAWCDKRSFAKLFDHLVGAQEERRGDRQPDRLCGVVEVDHQLELRPPRRSASTSRRRCSPAPTR
jgi:hypothetical protein